MTSLPQIPRANRGRILPAASRTGRTWRTVATVLLAATLHACGGGGGDGNTAPPPLASPAAGLDQRPSNTTCLAGASDANAGTIQLEAAFGRTFDAPLGLLQAPGNDSHWYVLEQAGRVRDFDATNTAPAATFVDVSAQVESGGEKGLLGMAFHPQYVSNRRVYLSYTHRTATNILVSRVAQFTAVDAGNGRRMLDAASEQILLTVTQPFDNHNGGHLAFGPDGLLYIGFGDGGSGGDPFNNGQRLDTVLGKLLRIDVDGGTPYSIPTDNPYVGGVLCNQGSAMGGGSRCPEIYASGLRNPWRWSFDRVTGELWLADVGQGNWEEVNLIQRGGNYGWNCREGAHEFNAANCPIEPPTDPVAEYSHDAGDFSITGGYVYRGTQPTSLQGRYLFADFGSGRIWTSVPGTREPRELLDSNANIASFGQSNAGELYIVDLNGTISRIVFEAGSGGVSAPAQLSATGCVDASNPAQAAVGLISYNVNAPFWSDGAEKERWLALPNATQIAVNSGEWTLPAGGVLMKHFRRDGRLIETRLLRHHTNGEWSGLTYEWNAEQTDAARVQGGARRSLPGGQEWLFPSEAECLQCHTAAAGRSLGLQTAQMNREHVYAQTQRTANQILTLDAIGVLSPAQGDPAGLPAMPNPTDTSAPLAARARAWLHTNCSHCHRPAGPTNSALDLRYATALSATNACNVVPNDSLGLDGMYLLTPGDAARSMIVNRANRRDAQQMPPFGSLVADQAGVALLSLWIDGLGGC